MLNSLTNLFKSFVQENPDRVKKFSQLGLSVVGITVLSLDVIMRKILILQNLDPDIDPAFVEKENLNKSFESIFSSGLNSAYSANSEKYDYNWVQNKFKEIREKLNQSNLTEKQLNDLTDVSKLNDCSNTLKVVSTKMETDSDPSSVSYTSEQVSNFVKQAETIEELKNKNNSQIEDLIQELDKTMEEPLPPMREIYISTPTTRFDFSETLKVLKKYADALSGPELGSENKFKGSFKRVK